MAMNKKKSMLISGIIFSILLCVSAAGFADQASPDQQLASIGLVMSAQEFVFDTGDSGVVMVTDPVILTDTYGLKVTKGEQVRVTNEGDGKILVESLSSGKSVSIQL